MITDKEMLRFEIEKTTRKLNKLLRKATRVYAMGELSSWLEVMGYSWGEETSSRQNEARVTWPPAELKGGFTAIPMIGVAIYDEPPVAVPIPTWVNDMISDVEGEETNE